MTSTHTDVRFGLVPLVARLLLIAEFVIAVNGKITGWTGQAAYMTAHGMQLVAPLLGAALVIEAAGATCIALGLWSRPAATVLFGYLGIVSVTLHDFWNQHGMAAGANMTEFFKNLGMMGGLLMVAAYGAGTWSLDWRRMRRGAPPAAPSYERT
ncbi:MAG TPA: DoxX family protein [Gemmatimonadales bacterium]|nr:DoxX family protein [Gemmatimonadales bacterium]